MFTTAQAMQSKMEFHCALGASTKPHTRTQKIRTQTHTHTHRERERERERGRERERRTHRHTDTLCEGNQNKVLPSADGRRGHGTAGHCEHWSPRPHQNKTITSVMDLSPSEEKAHTHTHTHTLTTHSQTH